ncbi:hypothetical protein [Undibacterium parvum]|uniref:Glycosyltransferase RgtA/B/C/D-like domain-containing protein n=1 Tax=Undibacterium parvum TaxID=401471 RepID=A0A3Q9BSY2_9BURK|nr:hypothetical protein [Undibacterium parvum]AZP13280.1 hypothetical protein EJN92_15500 [Undibacterium parvum]
MLKDSSNGKFSLIGFDKFPLVVYAICMLGFAITSASNYPGLMTPDSDFQFLQASSLSFSDWHPPIMALVWSALLNIVDGPLGMLFLFGALYWGSFALIAKSMGGRSKQAAALLLAFAFCPFSINFVGTIWKDVFVFVFFLFGLSIIVRSHFNGVLLKRRAAVFLVFIFATGALARHNAILSGMVLSVLCLTYTKNGTVKGFPRFVFIALNAMILFSVIFAGMFFTIDHFAKPEKKYASSSLFVYDLVGVSIRSKEYLLPKSESFNVENIKTCYENKGWDKVWASCPQLIDELNMNGDWKQLRGYWISAIAKYPTLYLKHRLYHFTSFFDPAWLVFNSEPTKINKDFGFKRSIFFNTMESYIKGAASAPGVSIFFTNGFWVLLNLFMVAYCFVRCSKKFEKNDIFLLLISLSGLAYSGPLILGGVAPDFRYVYWSIGSSIIFISFALSMSERKKTGGFPV